MISDGTKERLAVVINIAKCVFHYGFIPTVLYMGFKKGADQGMPEITLTSLLW